MSALRIVLSPRDGMFFKDGRGWATGAGERGHALPWPFPSTLLGAVRTAWGRAVEVAEGVTFTGEQWRERTRAIRLGTVIALRRPRGEPWSSGHRMWPVPADALYTETSRSVQRLDPVPCRQGVHTLGLPRDPAREVLWRPDIPAGKPMRPPALWTEAELASWLLDKAVLRLDPEELAARRMEARLDLRIGLDPDHGTVSEGALFVTETIETLQQTADDLLEWGIGLEASLPDDTQDLARIFTLGSDRRLATWEPIPGALFDRPPGLELRDAAGLRLIVVTPACFAAGWLPDDFAARDDEYRGRLPGVDAEVILRAAFVPRPAHVSGWDMEQGRPKPTRRLVPAGAVYFFEKVERTPFTAGEMGGLWLAALGADCDEGFGRVVAGPWEISR